MNYISQTNQVGKTSLHSVTCGKGDTVILLHGLTNNWESHIPLASYLCKRYTVIMIDLPGYGDSSPLPKYSVSIMASCVRDFIETLGIRPVSVIGLSMGGFVTTECIRSFSELARTVVVIGPVFRDKQYQITMLKYALKSASVIPSGKTLCKKLVGTKRHAYFMAKYVNMYRFDKDLVDRYGRNGKKKMTKEAYIDMGISIAEYSMEQAIAQVRVPTLLLYGRHDKISAPEYALEHILSKNPMLRLAVVEEAGHWVSIEKPGETAHEIIGFLNTAMQTS